MQQSVLTSTCFAAAITLSLVAVSPTHAQYLRGRQNARVSTVGDISASKLTPSVSKYLGMSFNTLGLFGDAEVYPTYDYDDFPAPFIFPFPNFSGAGYDFTNMSYDQYLMLVAKSYELNDPELYMNMYRYQNANPDALLLGEALSQRAPLLSQYQADLSAQVDLYEYYYGNMNSWSEDLYNYLLAQYQQYQQERLTYYEVLAQHEVDFIKGGGYLTLKGEPTTPFIPFDDPDNVEDPNDPFPGFDDPTTPVVTTNDIVEMAAQIAAGIEDADLAGALLDTVSAASASQDAVQAPNVAVVPEPAALGLIALGLTGALIRRR